MKRKFLFRLAAHLAILLWAGFAYGRGGGGGSGGGGGGGFGGGTSGRPEDIWLTLIIFAVVFGAFGTFIYLAIRARKQMIEKAKLEIGKAAAKDSAWKEADLQKRVNDVFYTFQKAWSNFDTLAMETVLTKEYFKRIVLELNVLQNEKRKNLVNNPKIIYMAILVANDMVNDAEDNFSVEIMAKANDVLEDTQNNKKLYEDNSAFREYWDFIREDGIWKLNLIRQQTENKLLFEKDIADFAKRNNFYYDPDFGWLMMPNVGVIFKKTNFQNSDINNHVIGYYRDKIVEFYTFIPNASQRASQNYLVAQAILPINYKNILIKKKSWLSFTPKGLRKILLESNDFNKKFNLYAHKNDQVSSLELLSPNFMEKIYNLPYDLNIEIVGSFLYFYTRKRNVSYDELLEIISWAFDEMKM